jgi:fucose permease
VTGTGRRPPRAAVDLLLTFLALGATGAVFGPALPALAEAADVTVAAASLTVAVLFAGLLVAVTVLRLVGATADRVLGPVRLGGALAQVGGLVGLALGGSLPLLLVAAGVIGLGFGASEAGASALVVTGRDGAGRLSRLGAAFAVAAIVTPLLVGASLAATGTVVPVLVGVAALHLAAVTAQLPRPRRPAVAVRRTGSVAADAAPATSGRLAAVLVLYVGVEVVLSTWLPEVTARLLTVPASVAATAATGFWGCLALGRWLGGRWVRALGPEILLRRLLVVAATSLLLSATTARFAVGSGGGSAAAVTLGVLAVAVVALGPVYALALAAHGAAPIAGSAATDGRGTAGGWRASRAPRSVVGTAATRIGLGAVGGLVVPAALAGTATGPVSVLASVGMLTVAAALAQPRPRLTRR